MSSEKLWTGPQLIAVAPSGSRQPALAAVNETLHLVWAADKVLYHAARTQGAWTEPVRVAAGQQPALVATPDGRLHCLFANEFAGNHEVYYVWWHGAQWSLPQPVSRTSGDSLYPTLAAGPDGTLHAAWVDTTPGYSVVYYGSRTGPMWTSLPVPNARGTMPALAVGPTGDVYLAWQSRLTATQRYDVLCSVGRKGAWALPQTVSDSPASHSVFAQLMISARGECHIVWQEEHEGLYRAQTAVYRGNGWTLPRDLSPLGEDVRLARIRGNRQGFLQAVWLQGHAICHRTRPLEDETAWFDTETVEHNCIALTDLALTLSESGTAHLIWSSLDQAGTRYLYHASRQPVVKPQVLLPG